MALLLTALLAAPAWADSSALPPGRPAGQDKAQLSNNGTIFVGAGVLILGMGLYLASGTYKIKGGSSPVVPPVTTTTTTTTTSTTTTP